VVLDQRRAQGLTQGGARHPNGRDGTGGVDSLRRAGRNARVAQRIDELQETVAHRLLGVSGGVWLYGT